MAATGSRFLEIIVIVVAGLVLAIGWPRLVHSPNPKGATLVLAVTTLTVGAALLVQGSEPYLEVMPAAMAVGIIAMCLHPLVHAPARERLARNLAGTAFGVLIISCGGVLTSTVPHGSSPIVIAGIALAVAALVDLRTERGGLVAWMMPIGMVVGGLTGLIAQFALSGEVHPWAALVGVFGAGIAIAMRRMLSQQPAANDVLGGIASGIASILVVGPLLHLVSRLPIS